jgi:hypothetical protein
MTKTYGEYLAELDDLLVDTRGEALTPGAALNLSNLARRAVMSARAELLDHIGRPANVHIGRPANVRVMDLRTADKYFSSMIVKQTPSED